jgi:hypothetical protein
MTLIITKRSRLAIQNPDVCPGFEWFERRTNSKAVKSRIRNPDTVRLSDGYCTYFYNLINAAKMWLVLVLMVVLGRGVGF